MPAPKALRSASQPSSGRNQSVQTPPAFVEPIRRSLGGAIGIDPCSNLLSWIPATVRIYLPDDPVHYVPRRQGHEARGRHRGVELRAVAKTAQAADAALQRDLAELRKLPTVRPECAATGYRGGYPTIVRGDGTALHWLQLVRTLGGARNGFVNPAWDDLPTWLPRCEEACRVWKMRILALLPYRPHRTHWEPVRRATATAELAPVTFDGHAQALGVPCVVVLWDPFDELGDFVPAWEPFSRAIYSAKTGARLDTPPALTQSDRKVTIGAMARTNTNKTKDSKLKRQVEDLRKLLSLALDELGSRRPRYGEKKPSPRADAVGRIVQRFGAGMRLADLEDRLRDVAYGGGGFYPRADDEVSLYELEDATLDMIVAAPEPAKAKGKKTAKKTTKAKGKKTAKKTTKAKGKKTAKKTTKAKGKKTAKKTTKSRAASKAISKLDAAHERAEAMRAKNGSTPPALAAAGNGVSEDTRSIVVKAIAAKPLNEPFKTTEIVNATGVPKRTVLRVLDSLNGAVIKTGGGAGTRHQRVTELHA